MTAESILKDNFYNGKFIEINSGDTELVINCMVEFAKYHCNQQLYEILNTIELITDKDVTAEGLVVKVTVDTKSITNAYPLNRIK